MISFNRSTRYAMTLALLALLIVLPSTSNGGIYVQHRFDMEPVGATTTEPGWTHMNHTINYVAGVSGGFDTANSVFYGTSNFGTSSQPPVLMRSDATMGRGADPADNSVRVIFHDIVPATATEATYKIYRDTPGDDYIPNFTINVVYNNGVATNSHPYPNDRPFTSEHPPVQGVLSWGGLPLTNGTLEFKFIDTSGFAESSTIRIAGIDILYTPEPAGALGMVGTLLLSCRRRRRDI